MPFFRKSDYLLGPYPGQPVAGDHRFGARRQHGSHLGRINAPPNWNAFDGMPGSTASANDTIACVVAAVRANGVLKRHAYESAVMVAATERSVDQVFGATQHLLIKKDDDEPREWCVDPESPDD